MGPLAEAAPPTGPLFYIFVFFVNCCGWVRAPVGQCLVTLSEGECGAEPPTTCIAYTCTVHVHTVASVAAVWLKEKNRLQITLAFAVRVRVRVRVFGGVCV